MATIVYRNAILLIDGSEITASLHDLGVEYSAELLDETAMGDDTRINKGGLKTASISGAGYSDPSATDIENVIFSRIGTDDAIVAIFPDGITEGSAVLGMGYAMKGVLEEFALGTQVGQMLDITFAAASRGIEA